MKAEHMSTKKSFLLILTSISLTAGVLLVALAMAATATAEEAPMFIGATQCGKCHKSSSKGNQLGQWQESAHAKAFEILASEEALQIAKKLGLETPPQENDACLKCHVTGHGESAERFDAKFDAAMGVQCESCHGAGSAYKSMKVMKDLEASTAAGLIAPVESVCVQCHNDESPTFESFDFKAASAEIAHPNPKKAK